MREVKPSEHRQILTRINFPYAFMRWAEEIGVVIEGVIIPKRYIGADDRAMRAYQTTDEYKQLWRWKSLYGSLSVPSSSFYQSFQYCPTDRDRFDTYWRFVRQEIKAPEPLIEEVNTAYEHFRREAEAMAGEHRDKIKQIKADCMKYVYERKTLYTPPINAEEEGR